MSVDPLSDVRHDGLLIDVVEKIVKTAVVQLQLLVLRAGGVEEKLTAARLCGLVVRAVKTGRSYAASICS